MSHVSFAYLASGQVGVVASFTYRGPGTSVRIAIVDDQEPSAVLTTTKSLPAATTDTAQSISVAKAINTAIVGLHTFTATLMALDISGNLRVVLGSATHTFQVFVPEVFGAVTFGF